MEREYLEKTYKRTEREEIYESGERVYKKDI